MLTDKNRYTGFWIMIHMDNKYKSGKIYKLWSCETDDFYVGSTVQPLYKRLADHRFDA